MDSPLMSAIYLLNMKENPFNPTPVMQLPKKNAPRQAH